jgi:hypothetical protein
MSLSDILLKIGLDDLRDPLMDLLNLNPLSMREDWRTCRQDLMNAVKRFIVLDLESYDMFDDHTEGLLTKIPDQYPISKWEREDMAGLNMKETLCAFFRFRRCRCCTTHCVKPNLLRHPREKWGKYEFVPAPVTDCECGCPCQEEAQGLMTLIQIRMRPELVA